MTLILFHYLGVAFYKDNYILSIFRLFLIVYRLKQLLLLLLIFIYI